MRPSFSIMMIALLLSGSITFLGSIREQRTDGHHKIIALADSGGTFSQSVTIVVQTKLSLLVVYNDGIRSLGLGANLTATDGRPVTGATITFYLQQISRHPSTDAWLELGASATNDAGVALLGLGLYGVYGPYRVKASHEQDINFSGAESIVDVVFPGGQAVHIRSDGSIDPPNAVIKKNGDFYTLTGDIVGDSGGISIERDNIVLDGAGHMIKPHPHIIGAYGISLVDRTNVTVENIHIESFFISIELSNCTNNTITKNRLTKSEYAATILEDTGATGTLGFFLDASSNNSMSENEVNSIEIGGFLDSSGNGICHNNFINHWSTQVSFDNSENTWDGGYPYGGNYWSDYNGTDYFSGPFQNETGNDGIGDVQYVVDGNNVDHYPLMRPVIEASVSVDSVLNLNCSNGGLIGAYIELPLDYSVVSINISTVTLNGTVLAELSPTAIGDFNNNSVRDLMVKFNRTEIAKLLVSSGMKFGNVTLTMMGQLNNGIFFEGNCTMKVSCLVGDVNCDGKVSLQDLQLLANAYHSHAGDKCWNDNADFAAPWGITSLTDLVTVAIYYGQHYP